MRDSLEIQSSDPDFTLCRICDVKLVHDKDISDEDSFWRCPNCGHLVNRWWTSKRVRRAMGENI